MKKIKIYNEVLAMLNEGADYQAITLSSIARRCDMGKSTIYEYFKSKDEMIFSALVYYMKKMIKYFSIDWDMADTREALGVYIKALIITMKANKWIVMPWSFDTYKAYFTEDNQLAVDKLLASGQSVVIAVLNSLAKNDKVLTSVTEDNVRFAFFGVVATLADKVDSEFDITSDECELLVSHCITYILKVLA